MALTPKAAKPRGYTILCAIASGWFIAWPVFASTVVLKSGKVIEGNIIEKTNKQLKLDIAGIPLTYYLDEIALIDSVPVEANIQNKKTVTYRVSKKFILKALDDASFVKFCMPLPQKDVLRQNITNIEVFPKINSFIKDESSYDIPVFYAQLLKRGEEMIVGTTYTVEVKESPSVEPSLIPDEYPHFDEKFKRYLSSEQDINIDNELIRAKARQLSEDLANPYQKAKALYDFITGHIHYDYELYEKIKSDMAEYTPSKPQDTMVSQKGICYDIAKLFVALSRASGIPARVVRGITFDAPKKVTKYIDIMGHAWAEIYLPIYGWVTCDPTYGISQKDKFYCFSSVSHIGEEYGLVQLKDFGSLEKGWALQVRRKKTDARYPVDVDIEIEIERLAEDISQQ